VLDIGQVTTIEFANAISGSSFLPYSANLLIYNGIGTYNTLLTALAYNTIGFSVNAMQATTMNVLVYNSISSNSLPQSLPASPNMIYNFHFINIAGNYNFKIYETDSRAGGRRSYLTVNALPRAYNYNVIINSGLATTSITSPLSPIILDSGQSYTISIALPTTGTPPYAYSWAVANGYSCPGFSNPGNVTSFTYSASATSSATCEFSATITDSATTPESYTAATPAITVNPAPTISLSPSNTLLDSGQTETYTLSISGGTGPFNAMLWNATGNKQMGSNVIIQPSGSNAVSFAVNSPTSANAFEFNAIAYDTGTAQPFVFNSPQNTIIVNNALNAGAITPSAPIIDDEHSITLTANPSGGTTPYAYQWYSTTASGTCSPSDTAISGAASQTYTTPLLYASVYYCYILTDSASSAATAYSQTDYITVKTTPTISISATNTLLDSGQSETINFTTDTEGTGPFNAMLWNVTGNKQMGSNIIIPLTDGDNSISFAVSSTSSNLIQFNGILFDFITTSETPVNSPTISITVNSVPVLSLNSIQSTNPGNVLSQSQPLSLIYGALPLISANTVGGTGPFSYNWIITDSSGIQIFSENQLANFAPSTTTAANSITAEDNLVLGGYLPVGSYNLYLLANDIGATTPYPYGDPITITVASNSIPAPTYSFSNSSGTAGRSSNGQYGSPYYTRDTFSFIGTETLNNQSAWKLYVNGALYSTTSSSASWSTQGIPGTYTLTFSNSGNANYTGNSITEILVVQQPASGLPPSPTTTITPVVHPKIIHNITVSNSVYSNFLNISVVPFTINFTNERIIFKLASNSVAGKQVKVSIMNVTLSVQNMTNKTYKKLAAFNFSTEQNITANAVFAYPCNIVNISVFRLANSIWSKIVSMQNAQACTVSFSVPSDPIIGIFSKNPATSPPRLNNTTIIPSIPSVNANALPIKKNLTSVVNLTSSNVIQKQVPTNSTANALLMPSAPSRPVQSAGSILVPLASISGIQIIAIAIAAVFAVLLIIIIILLVIILRLMRENAFLLRKKTIGKPMRR
jgi:hypothetical protein